MEGRKSQAKLLFLVNLKDRHCKSCLKNKNKWMRKVHRIVSLKRTKRKKKMKVRMYYLRMMMKMRGKMYCSRLNN